KFYQQLFTKAEELKMEEFLSKIPKRITTCMNESLLAELIDIEIKEAAFGLGATKAPGPDGLNGSFF
ncbi:hypothetical protein PIB30_079734, partial [Stylosanthes scabra]|nr:hypothetical protein [Stylosanthes scabra]